MPRRLAVLAALLLAAPSLAFAQASAVPGVISYQGKVTDASGTLIGATPTPGPQNRTVTFRIWDHASASAASNRLYSEQQTVTIANGEFSVLLGTGTPVSGETNTLALDAVFNGGATRYLGITVDDGNAGADPEVSPRQQIVTTAYAFRAKVAESVASQAVASGMIANNAVTTTQLADTAVTTAKVTDLAVTTAKLADGAITTAKIADGTIGTADLGNGQVTAAKLASDIGVWTQSGNNVYRTVGNVGLGTTNPQAMLSLGTTLANTKLALFDPGTSDIYGIGKQSAQFRFHVGNSGARFSFLNAPAGTEVFTILGNGNVGIGHTTPDLKLVVPGAIGVDGNGGYTFRGTGDFDGGIFSPADGQIVIRTDNAERVRINSTGIGIGHGNPQWGIHIYRPDNARIAFTHDVSGGGSADGLHVGSHHTAAFVWNYEATPLQFATNSTDRMVINSDGRFGINTPADNAVHMRIRAFPGITHILQMMDSNGSEAFAFAHNGEAYKKSGSGGFYGSSDRRLKTEIAPLTGALEQLLKLRSVTFRFKDEQRYAPGPQTGFIAQEVEEVFPSWVKTGPDGMLALGPKGFESLTVQALRELRTEKDAQIARLEARIKELETQNATNAQRFDALEKRLDAFARTATAAGNNQ